MEIYLPKDYFDKGIAEYHGDKISTLGSAIGIKTKEEKAFDKQDSVYPFVVKAGNIYNFNAIKNDNDKSLLIYLPTKTYTFKRNDQIINESDISYFVETVDTNFKYKINAEGTETTVSLQKITYKEEPIKLPTYLNNQNLNSVINIDANNSNFGNVGTFLTNQNIDYSQIFNDLKQVVECSYHVKELREMLKEIQETINKKQTLQENKIKKFFKFMGTQAVDLVKLLIVAYATASMTGIK